MFALQNKRRHEVEETSAEINQPTKRVCIDFGNAGGIQVQEYPMETWDMQESVQNMAHPGNIVSPSFTLNSYPYMASRNSNSGPCLRCLAGESGHINHLMKI
ncbi:uncharacterized protein si:ch211-221j21.3 [Erpetoichthys calabaricus]|uniref:uncharacterized protein si:ch211-221j21.3 n=1 Tax=Erpetoichthys calabaricus TaxID=27687 RepID=UPI0022341D76|nr:uncharacterized protein si:ch211-221j21.3 [Erpetoichthys calabaricus]